MTAFGHTTKARLGLIGLAITIGLSIEALAPAQPRVASITLDATVQHQTIIGWEAVVQAGQTDMPALFAEYQAELFDQAVFDLGLNRLRLEVKSRGRGNPFDLRNVDHEMELVVLPIKQRLEARNETLWLVATVVGNELDSDPVFFAAQVLALYEHLEGQYEIVPDSLEILEPDNFRWRSPQATAAALLAAAKLLESNGYEPYVIAPSSSCGVWHAFQYFGAMTDKVPELLTYVREFAYHRYCAPSDDELRQVAELGQRYGLLTSQLEHIGSGHEDLHADLKLANVAAWEQYTLAYPKCPVDDNGGAYYVISRCKGEAPVVNLGWRTRYLRQYFKYIRRGAIRIEATTTDADFDPVAFINTNGNYVVVIKATNAGQASIAGLPAGSYGVTYTNNQEAGAALQTVRIRAGQTLQTALPGPGVITVFATKVPSPRFVPGRWR
jgi:hypothetical protein